METGGPGEVSYATLLPAVKKYLSSHATPGTQGEVQNAIEHANKQKFNFVFFMIFQ